MCGLDLNDLLPYFPTIYCTLSAVMLCLAFADNTPVQNQISVFSFLYCCTFSLPRISQQKMIHEDNAGDNWAFAAVGTEQREPSFSISDTYTTRLFLNASCVMRLYWFDVSVGCCWCAHPASPQRWRAHVSLSVSVAAVFSSSQMLHSLFELQDLVDGHVSDSSPVSVQPGVWFTPDEITGVTLCKDV